MQKINIKSYTDLFYVKKVRVMNELKGKKSIIYLPSDYICYADDENGAVSFEKFTAEFDYISNQDVFSVCVDDFLWIGKDFKLTDNEEKKAFFGKTATRKNGGKLEYSSIHNRVSAVYTALCEGKIKIGDLNRVED